MSRNSKDNPYYEKRNHIRLPKNAVTKQEIMGGTSPTEPPTVLSNGIQLLCRWNVDDVVMGATADLVASANDQAGTLDTGPVSLNGRTTNSVNANDVPFEIAINGHRGFLFDKREANWLDEATMRMDGYVPNLNNTIAIAMTPVLPFPARAAGANWYILGNGSADTRGVYWGQSDGNWRSVGSDDLYINGVQTPTTAFPEASLADIRTLIMTDFSNTQAVVGGQARTYQDQSGLNQPNVYVHEVLIYGLPDNSDPTGVPNQADVDAINSYFMEKWHSSGPPVTDGLIGYYGADEGQFTVNGSDIVQTVTNQANPGTYDLTVGYVGATGDGDRLFHQSGYFDGGSSGYRTAETPPADHAAIEAEFQSGIVTHIHHLEFTSVSTTANDGCGAGAKDSNWPYTDGVKSFEFNPSGKVSMRGTVGGTGNTGYVSVDSVVNEKFVVAGSVDGPGVGANAKMYKDGVLTESGTTDTAYTADVGGPGLFQRSCMTIGRNRFAGNVGKRTRAAMYYNRVLTDQEIADVSAWLKYKYG